MGGYGSSRWGWYTAKTTVDESKTVSMPYLKERGFFAPGRVTEGAVSWSRGGRPTGSILVRVDLRDEADRRALFRYEVTRGSESKRIEEVVPLVSTPCNFGGYRLWFLCPRRVCERRCAMLHLPPGATHFRCRECHGLTYTSAQESRKYDSLFARIGAETGIDPRQVRRVLRG